MMPNGSDQNHEPAVPGRDTHQPAPTSSSDRARVERSCTWNELGRGFGVVTVLIILASCLGFVVHLSGSPLAITVLVIGSVIIWPLVVFAIAYEQKVYSRPTPPSETEQARESLEILTEAPVHLTPIATSDLCVVCWERDANLAFVPCGHKCICSDPKCASLINCPLCRSEAHHLCKLPDTVVSQHTSRDSDLSLSSGQSSPGNGSSGGSMMASSKDVMETVLGDGSTLELALGASGSAGSVPAVPVVEMADTGDKCGDAADAKSDVAIEVRTDDDEKVSGDIV